MEIGLIIIQNNPNKKPVVVRAYMIPEADPKNNRLRSLSEFGNPIFRFLIIIFLTDSGETVMR